MKPAAQHIRENKSLIEQIMAEYKTANGKGVAWSKAFNDHPDWRKQLIREPKDVSRLHQYAYVNRSESNGVHKRGKTRKLFDRNPSRIQNVDHPGFKLFHKHLAEIDEAVQPFLNANGNRVKWEKMLKAHPALVKTLDMYGPHRQRLLKRFMQLTDIMQPDRPSPKVRPTPLPDQPAPARPSQNGNGAPVTMRIGFCPACGTDFERVAAALPRGMELRVCPGCTLSIPKLQAALNAVVAYEAH